MSALVWVHDEFWSLGAVLDFLNSLPEERAVEAKIIAPEPLYLQGQTYRVVYRVERP